MLGAWSNIFQIISDNPPVSVDEHFEKLSASFGSADKCAVDVFHAGLI